MSDRCDLCGLPLGRSEIEQSIDGETLRFCCPGCRQVFLLLASDGRSLRANLKETDLYRICVESGIIPGVKAATPHSVSNAGLDSDISFPPLYLALRLDGMWCPACAWLIEEVLRRMDGVLEPHVSFLSDSVEMKYLPHVVSPAEITSRIMRLGYKASPFSETASGISGKNDVLSRLGISAILSANVMMVSCALYFGLFRDLSSTVIAYFSIPLLTLTTPVVFYGGFPILKKAALGLIYGKASMDTLISLGILSAYCYSVIQMASGSTHLYFDTACMLVTLVLAGKYIETWARHKVAEGIVPLRDLAGQKVRLQKNDREEWIGPDLVKPGDRFLVRSGERAPIDGTILQGRGSLDESILTGESRPRHKSAGQEVMAGSLLNDGELLLTATRVGSDSSLQQMVSLVKEALDRKVPVELLADRITAFFVPAVLCIAAFSGFLLFMRSVPAHEVLLRMLTVLLISCPCALGIATPLVKVAMLGIARSKGLLVRNLEALERAHELDVMLFDKTGTITEGNFALQRVITEDLSEEEVLARVAALETASSHILAREIVRSASRSGRPIYKAEEVEEVVARGVKGMVNDQKVVIGNQRFMQEHEMKLPVRFNNAAIERQKEGMTVLFFGWERQVRGILVFGDAVKKGARDMVRRLQERHIAVRIVSGDAKGTTAAVAAAVGIGEYCGEMLPAEKAQLIASLKRAGCNVGMVGDGLNDASALAQADVGFALGNGSHLIRDASDVTILSAEPEKVLDVLDLSRLATKSIRQNLLFAFLYNGVAIPFAISGLLNPLIAVLAMFGSSFTVIGNALRLARKKQAHHKPEQQLMAREVQAGGIP